MSVFTELFPKHGGMKKYLLFTNEFREISMFAIDEDGKASDFVTGDFDDLFCNVFNKANKHQKAVILDCEPYEFWCNDWKELCDKLNNKKKNKQKILFDKWELRDIAEQFIEYDETTKQWKVKNGDAPQDTTEAMKNIENVR